jgi:adenine C2-methylase RlmN of 23S rRNA A2503 and tRNA A37
MAAMTEPFVHSVAITEDERAELVRLLEESLRESRVEAHRTHTPDYRERVLGEQALLRALLDKFQHMRVDE